MCSNGRCEEEEFDCMGKLVLVKLLLGKLMTGEVSVGEISGWGNCCWGSCDWGNDLTPYKHPANDSINFRIRNFFRHYVKKTVDFRRSISKLCNA